jgi:hypothetical protein
MLQRSFVSFVLAALATVATTGSAFAAFDPTKDELSIGTFVFALVVMFVLLSIYAVKWYFGFDQHANTETPDSHSDHH